jgi:hypothetical protein
MVFLARGPLPADAAKAWVFAGVVGEDGFAEGFFEAEVLASGDALKGFDERRSVGDDDDLRAFAGGGDETRERRQQVGMKAGLRLVEDHEAGRARCEQCGGPEEKAQRAVGELRGGERAEQAVLLEPEVEAAGLHFDAEAAAGKGVVDGAMQGFIFANFENGFERGGEVGAVVIEHRGAGADLRDADGRGDVGAKAIVEAPAADEFADGEHFGRALGIGDGGEHAVGGGEAFGEDHVIVGIFAGQGDEVVVAIDERRGPSIYVTVPDTFAFDLGIEIEECGGRRWRRIAEVDGITVGIGSEAELEAGGFLLRGGLDGMVAAFDGAADDLRTGPERGGKAAFARERGDDGVEGGVGEETQSAIEAGFAGAVGASDEGEAIEGQHEVAEGTIARDREGVDHGGGLSLTRVWGCRCSMQKSRFLYFTSLLPR